MTICTGGILMGNNKKQLFEMNIIAIVIVVFVVKLKSPEKVSVMSIY